MPYSKSKLLKSSCIFDKAGGKFDCDSFHFRSFNDAVARFCNFCSAPLANSLGFFFFDIRPRVAFSCFHFSALGLGGSGISCRFAMGVFTVSKKIGDSGSTGSGVLLKERLYMSFSVHVFFEFKCVLNSSGVKSFNLGFWRLFGVVNCDKPILELRS